jgi:tRNA A-37 threonylcarbamoyl transferase component Bud32
MIVTCTYCNQSFDTGSPQWPGDVLPCPFCKLEIRLAKSESELKNAQTVSMGRSTEAMELSPGAGEFRPMSVTDDEVLPDGAMLGQYRIEAFIGRGGMGSVYRAKHSMLQRDVAIKVLPPKFAKDPEFVQRFKREALALANLSHPNIVAIHDMGVQGEIYFFVMEYVDGLNLRDVLEKKKLPPDQALKIVPQLCEALEYAHSKNIIHRDIKPENIIVDRAGLAKIADFGLAKIVKGETATSVPLTQTNVVMGTVEYMAPEQREALKYVDHRADIYSMGVVLYEMLTGELPVGKFDLPSRRVAIDVRIDDIVLKALEKEPDRRYQRASHLGTEVTQVSKAPSGVAEWSVVDQRSGKGLGTARERRITLRTGDAEVRVGGWDRQEIGVDIEGKFRWESEMSLVVAEGAERVSVTVPRGAEVTIMAHGGGVSAAGLVGSLAVRGTEGGVEVVGFEGRLEITSSEGDISVDNLKSESVDIRSGEGSVRVVGLELVRGRVAIETEEGAIDVTATPSSSFRYQAFTREGSLAMPTGASITEKSASGCVGTSAGSLSLRSGEGDVGLTVGAAASGPSAAGIWTPQLMEKLGTFAIINVALWAFFLYLRMPFPAMCVTVFWGMSIALDVWKKIMRASKGTPSEPPAKVEVKATIAPTPAVEATPAAASLSMWPILGMLSILPTIGSIVALGVAGLVLLGTRDPWGQHTHEAWAAVAATSFAALLTGVVSVAFGLAARAQIREFRGTLRGRPLATMTTCFGLVAVLAALLWAQPVLKDVKEAGASAQAVAEELIRAKASGDTTALHALMADAERKFVGESELKEAVRAWKTADTPRIVSVGISSDREKASVLIFASLEGRRTPLLTVKLQRTEESWRVVEAKELVKVLKGATNE